MNPLTGRRCGLDAAERERYSRHLLLPGVGMQGQERLKAARVLVVGAGGLGSPVLQYLAAAGVGTIGLVDDDVVDASNLQRQVVHGSADVGRTKTSSAVDALARLNSGVSVVAHHVRLTAANACDLVGGYDLVVDGSDNFATRYLVNDACVLTGTPWVWGAVLRFTGHVASFAPSGPTYRDLFPTPPAPGTVPGCSEAGVLGAVCGIVGSVMATEAVKLICGTGAPLTGRVLVLDAQTWSWRTLTLHPDPDRPPVTAVVPDEPTGAADVPRISVEEFLAERSLDPELLLLDVRTPAEHAVDSIPGAVLVPLPELAAAELPAGRRTVVHCAGGTRSLEAVRILRERGHEDVASLDGGIAAWRRVRREG